MTGQIQEIVVMPSDDSRLFYSLDNAVWRELQHVADMRATQGGLSEVQTETFEDGPGKVPGAEVVQNVTLAIPNFAPQLEGWQEVDDAQRAKALVYWRVDTRQELVHSGTEVSVAGDGTITFRDDPPAYGVGMVVRVGDTDYVIDAAEEAGVSTRSAVPAPVDRKAYELVVPALRLEFRGWVKSISNYSLLAAQPLASALEIMLPEVLPKWRIVR